MATAASLRAFFAAAAASEALLGASLRLDPDAGAASAVASALGDAVIAAAAAEAPPSLRDCVRGAGEYARCFATCAWSATLAYNAAACLARFCESFGFWSTHPWQYQESRGTTGTSAQAWWYHSEQLSHCISTPCALSSSLSPLPEETSTHKQTEARTRKRRNQTRKSKSKNRTNRGRNS